jgi:hypothetical protein
MTTKNKRVAQQRAANPQPASGMITPPEVVAGLIVRRTIGEDEVFGRCSHALQLLPNGVILLLVTTDDGDEGPEVSTLMLGEEIPGFTVQKSMIETLDETA